MATSKNFRYPEDEEFDDSDSSTSSDSDSSTSSDSDCSSSSDFDCTSTSTIGRSNGIHISNLHKSINNKSLLESIFKKYGRIRKSYIATNKKTQQPLGYASVFFDLDGDKIADVIEETNKLMVKGQEIRVQRHISREVRELVKPFRNLYFKNFIKDYGSERELQKEFGQFGKIASLKLERNSDDSLKGFGFVCFEDADKAKVAMHVLNGKALPSGAKFFVTKHATKSEKARMASGSSSSINASEGCRDLSEMKPRNSSIKQAHFKGKHDPRPKPSHEVYHHGGRGKNNQPQASLPTKSIPPRRSVPSHGYQMQVHNQGGHGAKNHSQASVPGKNIQHQSQPRRSGSSHTYQTQVHKFHHQAERGEKDQPQASVRAKSIQRQSGSKGVLPRTNPGLSRSYHTQVSSLDTNNLYVKNLGGAIEKNSQLFNEFKDFGVIISAKIMKDIRGASKGFGFVCFEKRIQAKLAMHAMSGTKLKNGKKLYVGPAEKKLERQRKLRQQFREKSRLKFNENYERNVVSRRSRRSCQTETDGDREKLICNICYTENAPAESVLLDCGHMNCKTCLIDWLNFLISNRQIDSVMCPDQNCEQEIEAYLVRALVGDKLFDKYDEILLENLLATFEDIVRCPKPDCQCPVNIVGNNPTYGNCPKCSFIFCTNCEETYHGTNPCDEFEDEDHKRRILEEYRTGAVAARQALEKRYGKQKLQNYANELCIKANCKACPVCKANIEKHGGCNHMTCRVCQSHFCWVCGQELSRLNPYEHFRRVGATCSDGIL